MKRTVIGFVYFRFLLPAICFLFSAQLLFSQESNIPKGFISAREFAESQGISYKWHPLQKTLVLSRGKRSMKLTVDKTDAEVDGQAFTLPSSPKLEDGQVMVPARSVINIFGSSNVASVQNPATINQESNLGPETPAKESPEEPPSPTPVLIAPSKRETSPTTDNEEETSDDNETKLVTVRHSPRDDQTRVVLEFDGPVSFSNETPAKNKFKLRIDGCKNLIPTKRSNPSGREIKNVTFNSGPNRQGLVVSFELTEGSTPPAIETVSNPYRIVLTFLASKGKLPTASATLKIKTASETAAIKSISATSTATLPIKTVASSTTSSLSPTSPTAKSPNISQPPSIVAEAPPEIKIDVPLASLSRSIFLGRIIVVDPGHGGQDSGVTVPGDNSQPEKQITLNIALKLRQILKKMGFKVVLLRSQDVDLPQNERLALANRAGGDLLISIHVGGSLDETVEGTACYSFDTTGINFDIETGSKLSPQLVFSEWCQNSRFDLSKFLAENIKNRMVQHLSLKDRGTRTLPLLPLRFLISPAVVLEVGMLSNTQEAKKLSSNGFQEAIARAIANGVVKFFDGIRIDQ